WRRGSDRLEVPGETPQPALRLGSGTGRRPEPLVARRAHPRPPWPAVGTPPQMGAATARTRCRARRRVAAVHGPRRWVRHPVANARRLAAGALATAAGAGGWRDQLRRPGAGRRVTAP